jgi:protoheme ferro-lyase
VIREFAERNGIEYWRVPMPNDADEVVEAIAHRVLESSTPGHGLDEPRLSR